MGAAGRVDEVRVLPFRVRPLPDEPFDSWLETMAATYQSSISEMGCALGLIEQRDGVAVSATSWMANGWATQLSDLQATRLQAATGIRAEQFQEMTRMRFAQHAIRYTRQGRVSPRCPAGGTGGRYCPECLADSDGRWRMSWQFPFGFACHRHRRILDDTCPICDRPPRRVGHPLALIPVPGQCHNPIDGAGTGPQSSRCRGDLASGAAVVEAPPSVLAAQRRLMQIVSSGQARFGIYEHAPQPALSVLEDVRLLARVARSSFGIHGSISDGVIPPDLIDLFAQSSATSTSDIGDTALDAAIGNAAAIAVLENPDAITELLRGRLAVSTSHTMHTPQMQTLIAASFGRKRRPTMFLQSAPISGHDPAERARKVPAQIWDDWMKQHAAHRIDPEIVASALSAAVVFTGTRLTHAAALALLDPGAPSRRVTNVMRELGRREHETGTLRAILRLAAYLDTHDVPIDYAHRRALDCTNLLPEDRWMQLCWRLNLQPGGGARWRNARALLHRMLTGSAIRTVPAGWQSSGVTSNSVIAFERSLPDHVRAELEIAGREFLAAHQIDGPLTWTPHLDQPVDASSESTTSPPPWVPARAARAELAEILPAAGLTRAYDAGGTTYEIARETGVSRQTVSRALSELGVVTRRGRKPSLSIDGAWLRDQYEDQHRTIRQLADLAGCSASTIARRLRGAGVALCPPGGSHDVRAPTHATTPAVTSWRVITGLASGERSRQDLVLAEE
ncbi:TniQ family protein [Microbacterium lacticum]|uniref:TniQ family protein n=1 Tax=Microbacterium lacticum TaxID=33885 RepID=UPI003A86F565